MDNAHNRLTAEAGTFAMDGQRLIALAPPAGGPSAPGGPCPSAAAQAALYAQAAARYTALRDSHLHPLNRSLHPTSTAEIR